MSEHAKRLNTATAAAYEILSWRADGSDYWTLCRWAEPDRFALAVDRRKPSPEARIRRVRIIREKDYLALLKAARRAQPDQEER